MLRSMKTHALLLASLLLIPFHAFGNGDQMVRQAMNEFFNNANVDKAFDLISKANTTYPNFRVAQYLHAEFYSAMAGGAVAMPEKKSASEAESPYNFIEEIKYRSLIPRNLNELKPLQILKMPINVDFVILVDASISRAYLLKNTNDQPTWVGDYYVSIGKLGVGKQIEGDQKTPLGLYHVGDEVNKKFLTPFYGNGALKLNFPNSFDKFSEKSGSGIWLHGAPPETYNRAPKASDGCIVFTNDDMENIIKIAQRASINVFIAPQVTWLKPAEWNQRYRKLMAEITEPLGTNSMSAKAQNSKKDLLAIYVLDKENSVIVDRGNTAVNYGANKTSNYYREYWDKIGSAWTLRFTTKFKS